MRLGGLSLVLTLVLTAPVGIWAGAAIWGPPDLSRWHGAMDDAARASGVEGALLRAMVAAESGGSARAVSRKGARGLLQLRPATARAEAERLGVAMRRDDDLFDPVLNLRLGAAYMARLLRRYSGSEAYALAAYNAGPTAVNRWRAAHPDLDPREVVRREAYGETRRYVARVLHWRRHYAK